MPSPIQILWIIAGALAVGILIVTVIVLLLPQEEHETSEKYYPSDATEETHPDLGSGWIKKSHGGGAWSWEQRR